MNELCHKRLFVLPLWTLEMKVIPSTIPAQSNDSQPDSPTATTAKVSQVLFPIARSMTKKRCQMQKSKKEVSLPQKVIDTKKPLCSFVMASFFCTRNSLLDKFQKSRPPTRSGSPEYVKNHSNTFSRPTGIKGFSSERGGSAQRKNSHQVVKQHPSAKSKKYPSP